VIACEPSNHSALKNADARRHSAFVSAIRPADSLDGRRFVVASKWKTLVTTTFQQKMTPKGSKSSVRLKCSVFWIMGVCLTTLAPGNGFLKLGLAQDAAEAISSEKKAGVTVAAKVGDDPVSVGSARVLLEKSLPLAAQQLDDEWVNVCVNQLVNRRIVYDYLDINGFSVGEGEKRLALGEFAQELAKFNKTIAQYAAAKSRFTEEIEFEVVWQIAWERYLAKKLSDEYLKSFFEKCRCEFDGSRMRVAHLLIKSDRETDSSIGERRELAEQIFDQIQAGAMGWEEAVRQFSDAPTRDSGGELGWIEYAKPMPTEFSRAAFGLQPAGISRPVKTPFGWHLIKCLEIEPGKIGWRDAFEAVRRRAAVEEFHRIVEPHREALEIEFKSGFRRLKLKSHSWRQDPSQLSKEKAQPDG
jgi:peptidyl-prolyl cis-trans isomerase SurA